MYLYKLYLDPLCNFCTFLATTFYWMYRLVCISWPIVQIHNALFTTFCKPRQIRDMVAACCHDQSCLFLNYAHCKKCRLHIFCVDGQPVFREQMMPSNRKLSAYHKATYLASLAFNKMNDKER